jgi:S-adenosylmethionine:tRNA ribosyltransferase-isomerase
MESVYRYGVQLINGKADAGDICIDQWEPYVRTSFIPAEVSLSAVLNEMKKRGIESITGRTGIIIVPGYEFKVFSGLITNFHQPQSTLLLLVAAFIGRDWKKVYDYALINDFRFLSYGDSSILFK